MTRRALCSFLALVCVASASQAQVYTPYNFGTGLNGPRFMTQLADGTVLVAEYLGGRVSAYPPGGGNANRTDFATGLGGPASVTQLADGTVLVVEWNASRVSAFPASGGNTNRTDFATGLTEPYGVTQLADGTVLVAEHSAGRVSAFAASGGNATRTDFATGLGAPAGVTQLVDGTVLVAERNNNRVSAYPASGGNANRTDFATGLNLPYGVTQLADGSVLVAEYGGGRVSAFPTSGGASNRSDFATGLSQPIATIQLDDGTVLVVEVANNRVLAFGLTRRTFASGMNTTQGVAERSDGRILIADFGANVIREYAADGTRQADFAAVAGNPTDLVELPNGVVLASLIGTDVIAAFDASGSRLTPDYATGLNNPTGFGVLADGRVVVTEQAGSQVTVVADASGGRVTPTTFISGLSGPFDLARLADGRMLVTERTANKVSVISDASGNALSSPAPLVTSLNNPTGITQLGDGRVLVSEFNDSEATVFNADGSGQTQFAGSLVKPTFVTQLSDGRVLVAQEQISGAGTGQVTVFGGLSAPSTPSAPQVSVGTDEGWEIVAAPGTSTSVGAFFDGVWTQCFPGADYAGPACGSGSDRANVFFYDETQPGALSVGFEAPTAASDAVPPGIGVFVFLYADDDFDGTDEGFPKLLFPDGAEPSLPFTWGGVGADAALTFTDDSAVSNDNDGWNLLGNPLRGTFSWNATYDNGATNVSPVAHLYDRGTNSYATYDADNNVRSGPAGVFTGGEVPEGVGFYVQTTGASPTMTAPTGAAVRTRPGEPAPHVAVRVEEVDGWRSAGAALILAEGATFARDAADAAALLPPEAPFVMAGFVTEAEGPAYASAVVPGPSSLATGTEVALALGASGLAQAELAWEVALPAGWRAVLLDAAENVEVEMSEGARYAVDLSALSAEPRTGRFSVRLLAGPVSAEDDAVASLTLSAPQPNPTDGRSRVEVGVPAAGDVHVAVYDALGREVAVLHDGPAAAGPLPLAIDTGAFAPGTYIVRVRSAAGASTRTLTVIR